MANGITLAVPSYPRQQSASGLSVRTIEALAAEYQDRCYRDYHEAGSSDLVDYWKLDAWLREQITGMGVWGDHVARTFDRVMAVVFDVNVHA